MHLPPAPRRKAGIEISPLQFGAAVVTLILIFLLGFQYGGRREDDRGETQALARHAQRQVVLMRKSVKECNAALAQPLLSPNNSVVQEGLNQLNLMIDAMDKDSERVRQERDQCETQRANEQRNWDEEDEVHKGLIKILTEDSKRLAAETKQIAQTTGMRTNLLTLLLRKARLRNLQLSQRLGIPVPLVSGAEYDETVLNRNKAKIESGDNSTVMLLTAKQKQDDLIRNWVKFRYDASKHTDIFIPTLDGLLPSRPAYFGRVGTGPVVRGTFIQRQRQRQGSSVSRYANEPAYTANFATMGLPSAIRSTYNIALCAYRNNIPNFTYPNAFYNREYGEKNLARLNELVDTPLISFCTDCNDMRNTRLFQEACRGDTVESIYGGEDFWSMRSMIRFQPDLIAAARDQLMELNLGQESKTLTVAFRQSQRLKGACMYNQRRLPLRPYIWLRGNYPEYEPIEVSPTAVDHQCLPGLEDLQRGIKAIAANASIDKFDVVFISVERSMDTSVFDNVQLYAKRVVVIQPQTADEEVVELLIGASSKYLLANRFSEHSQVLIEMFLLRNKLSPFNIHFF